VVCIQPRPLPVYELIPFKLKVLLTGYETVWMFCSRLDMNCISIHYAGGGPGRIAGPAGGIWRHGENQNQNQDWLTDSAAEE